MMLIAIHLPRRKNMQWMQWCCSRMHNILMISQDANSAAIAVAELQRDGQQVGGARIEPSSKAHFCYTLILTDCSITFDCCVCKAHLCGGCSRDGFFIGDLPDKRMVAWCVTLLWNGCLGFYLSEKAGIYVMANIVTALETEKCPPCHMIFQSKHIWESTFACKKCGTEKIYTNVRCTDCKKFQIM